MTTTNSVNQRSRIKWLGARLSLLAALYVSLAWIAVHFLNGVPTCELDLADGDRILAARPGGLIVVSHESKTNNPWQAPLSLHRFDDGKAFEPASQHPAEHGRPSHWTAADKSAIVISPGGRHFAAVTDAGSLLLLDLQTGQFSDDRPIGNAECKVAFSPSGRLVAAWHRDRFIVLRTADGEKVAETDVDGYAAQIELMYEEYAIPAWHKWRIMTDLEFSTCETKVCIVSRTTERKPVYCVAVVDIETGTATVRTTLPGRIPKRTRDGRVLLVEHVSGQQRLDLGNGIKSCVFSVDGLTGIYSDDPNSTKWRVLTERRTSVEVNYMGTTLDLVDAATGAIDSHYSPWLSQSHDGGRAAWLAPSSQDSVVPILCWRDLINDKRHEIRSLTGHISKIFLSPDGSTIAVITDRRPERHFDRIFDRGIDWAHDVARVDLRAYRSSRQATRTLFWEAPTGRLLLDLPEQEHTFVDFSADGMAIIARGPGGKYSLWTLPPPHNWPAAFKIALVPALLLTFLLMACSPLLRLRRTRRAHQTAPPNADQGRAEAQ